AHRLSATLASGTQSFADSGAEVVERERLAEESIGARRIAVKLLFRLGIAGHQYHVRERRAGPPLDPSCRLRSVQIGHLKVEDHYFGRGSRYDFERPLPAFRYEDFRRDFSKSFLE